MICCRPGAGAGASAGAGAGAASGATHGHAIPSRAQFLSLVQGLDWVPVLIDFGLTKRIGDSMRLALAKMVVSAELLDYGGLLDSHQVRPGACVCHCMFVHYVGGDWRCV